MYPCTISQKIVCNVVFNAERLNIFTCGISLCLIAEEKSLDKQAAPQHLKQVLLLRFALSFEIFELIHFAICFDLTDTKLLPIGQSQTCLNFAECS